MDWHATLCFTFKEFWVLLKTPRPPLYCCLCTALSSVKTGLVFSHVIFSKLVFCDYNKTPEVINLHRGRLILAHIWEGLLYNQRAHSEAVHPGRNARRARLRPPEPGSQGEAGRRLVPLRLPRARLLGPGLPLRPTCRFCERPVVCGLRPAWTTWAFGGHTVSSSSLLTVSCLIPDPPL